MDKNWIPRSVPWSCWAEWIKVKEELFSRDAADIQCAVNKIGVWLTRSALVPSAIENTAALIEAMELYQRTVDVREGPDHFLLPVQSAKPLQLMLAMAIVRFVNGSVDSFLPFGSTDRHSVKAVARKLGIDSIIVHIRHKSTHHSLLPLSTLYKAACSSVGWLRENYWDAQLVAITNLPKYPLQSRPEAFSMTQMLSQYQKPPSGSLLFLSLHSRATHLTHTHTPTHKEGK